MQNTTTTSQTEQILKYLQSGKSITPIEALNLFGCLRLSGRVFDLRHLGFNIRSEPYKTESGKIVSKYSLIP